MIMVVDEKRMRLDNDRISAVYFLHYIGIRGLEADRTFGPSKNAIPRGSASEQVGEEY